MTDRPVTTSLHELSPQNQSGDGKAVISATANASPAAVWSVLADGWLYATWVVGASRIRDVDPHWPAAGSRIHHSVGLWPVLINDHTEVLDSEPERRLVLRGRAWPAGEAHVHITVEPGPGGTEITIREDVIAGPGRFVPKPVRQILFVPRNKEALRRLALIAEGRHQGT